MGKRVKKQEKNHTNETKSRNKAKKKGRTVKAESFFRFSDCYNAQRLKYFQNVKKKKKKEEEEEEAHK